MVGIWYFQLCGLEQVVSSAGIITYNVGCRSSHVSLPEPLQNYLPVIKSTKYIIHPFSIVNQNWVHFHIIQSHWISLVCVIYEKYEMEVTI